MEIEKGEAVVYVDGYGREHDALLTALNPMNAGFATLVYVDVNAPEPDNVKKLFDVAHVSHVSKDEPNPDLPSYDVNCWKQPWERHKALPADHPAFDHPFVEPKYDEAGQRVPIERPATEAEIAAHQAELGQKAKDSACAQVEGGIMCGEPLTAHTPEAAKMDVGMDHNFVPGTFDPTVPINDPMPSADDLGPQTSAEPVIETKQYTDGCPATGVAPLPDQSPAQQEAAQPSAAPPAEEGQSE